MSIYMCTCQIDKKGQGDTDFIEKFPIWTHPRLKKVIPKNRNSRNELKPHALKTTRCDISKNQNYNFQVY